MTAKPEMVFTIAALESMSEEKLNEIVDKVMATPKSASALKSMMRSVVRSALKSAAKSVARSPGRQV
jgi:hypothetical protein